MSKKTKKTPPQEPEFLGEKMTDFERNLFLKRKVKDLEVELGKQRAFTDEWIFKYNEIKKEQKVKYIYRGQELQKKIQDQRKFIRGLNEKLKEVKAENENLKNKPVCGCC